MVKAKSAMDIKTQKGLRRTGSILRLKRFSRGGQRMHIERTECYLCQDGVELQSGFCKKL